MGIFVTKVEMKDVSRILRPFAKIFAVTAMIFALISQVVNIGMTGSERYGLKEFKFFFPMSFQFLAVAMVAIAVISNKQSRKNYRYYICMCIALILATKSSPLLFSVFFLILLVYLKKREELKTSTLVILGVLVLILGTFQIQTYSFIMEEKQLILIFRLELVFQHLDLIKLQEIILNYIFDMVLMDYLE